LAENREHKFFYGYVVVAAAFIVMTICSGLMYSFGVFFKPLLAEFGWTRAMTSGAFSLHVVLHGFLYIFTGRLNDRFGPRLVMTFCAFFYGLGYILMSQIGSIWQLYLFYGVIVAIGMSGAFVPMISTVSRWFVKRRGLMTSIVATGVGFGTLIMPPIANQLIFSYGWRNCFIIVGSSALVILLLVAQFLRRDPSQKGQLPYGQGGATQQSLGLVAEGYSPDKAIQTRQFWLLCTMFFFSYGVPFFSIMAHISLHAIDMGISATSAANILAIIGGLSIAGRLTMGITADRIGNKISIIITIILMSIALFWLLAAKELWMFYLFAAILGFAYGGLVTLMSPMVAELFGLTSHGVILGIIIFIGTVGGAIGPVLAGSISDITGSYQLAFLINAVVSIIGLILVSQLRPITS